MILYILLPEQLKNELTSQAERHKNDIDRHAVEIQQELQRQAEGNTAVFSEKKKQGQFYQTPWSRNTNVFIKRVIKNACPTKSRSVL